MKRVLPKKEEDLKLYENLSILFSLVFVIAMFVKFMFF